MPHTAEIPKLTREELIARALKIKPVIWENNLQFIKPVDLERVAFTWDPKPVKKAKGLTELFRQTTYHHCNYYGFFKPSIAEVLAQIPEDKIKGIVAFSTDLVSTNIDQCVTDDYNYHIATTVFYGGRLPKEIKKQDIILDRAKIDLARPQGPA